MWCASNDERKEPQPSSRTGFMNFSGPPLSRKSSFMVICASINRCIYHPCHRSFGLVRRSVSPIGHWQPIPWACRTSTETTVVHCETTGSTRCERLEGWTKIQPKQAQRRHTWPPHPPTTNKVSIFLVTLWTVVFSNHPLTSHLLWWNSFVLLEMPSAMHPLDEQGATAPSPPPITATSAPMRTIQGTHQLVLRSRILHPMYTHYVTDQFLVGACRQDVRPQQNFHSLWPLNNANSILGMYLKP